jgi:hypothetical protein
VTKSDFYLSYDFKDKREEIIEGMRLKTGSFESESIFSAIIDLSPIILTIEESCLFIYDDTSRLISTIEYFKKVNNKFFAEKIYQRTYK